MRLLALCVSALLVSFAASIAIAADPTPAPAAPTAAKNTDIFEALERQTREEEARKKLATARSEREQAERSTGAVAGPTGFPTLIRIYGQAGHEVAQFKHGSGVYEAAVGDLVTTNARLVRVLPNAVIIRDDDGKERAMVMGSRAPQPIARATAGERTPIAPVAPATIVAPPSKSP